MQSALIAAGMVEELDIAWWIPRRDGGSASAGAGGLPPARRGQ
ncbi:MAG: hypothetical protein ACLUI3_15890 [Christensenellales bacterium]